MPDELVFSVEGSVAHSLEEVGLARLHLKERRHLQQWVIDNPVIVGPDLLVVAFEFDKWGVSKGVPPHDRLDVLALGSDGRLVVAELKRGRAPDTVDLQAVKYAAMASRFTEETLVQLYTDFLNSGHGEGDHVDEDEAAARLSNHVTAGFSAESFLSPKIVIFAEDYSATVAFSAAWLHDQGIDITLKRYKAYSTASGEAILTVSQYYPISEIEIAPHPAKKPDFLAAVPWSRDDLILLLSLPFEVPHVLMDLCADQPEQWVGSSDVYEAARIDPRSGMGRLAGFGYSVRHRFRRSNPPWKSQWAQGGISQQYYSLDMPTAQMWKDVRAAAE